MTKRIVLPRPLRGLIGAAAGWTLGWGFFRIIKDDLFVLGTASMVFGAALIVLGLMSEDRNKARERMTRTTPEKKEER